MSARSRQAERAEEAYRITLERFDAGGVSEVDLIDAERAAAAAPAERLQAQASRYSRRRGAVPGPGRRLDASSGRRGSVGGFGAYCAQTLIQAFAVDPRAFSPYNCGLFAFRTSGASKTGPRPVRDAYLAAATRSRPRREKSGPSAAPE